MTYKECLGDSGRTVRVMRRIALLVFTCLLFTRLASAQFDTGTIAGSVTDPSGALIPQAAVTITNVETLVARTLATGDTGTFVASGLPFGTYVVSATAAGFTKATSQPLVLHVAASVEVKLILSIAATQQTIEVTGTAATVDTSSTTAGTTLNSNQIADLPTNGRDLMDFLEVAPGSVYSTGVFQGSVNGLENVFTGLNILLDGSDATRGDINGFLETEGAEASRVTRASVDSVQEIDFMENGYKAQYGRSLGPVMDIITKSGTNQYHGELFEFVRNDSLNAANFFEDATGVKKQPFKLNQFGGNIGGPIIKDKLFFFANYEGVRQQIPTTSVLNETPALVVRNAFVPAMAPVKAALVPLPANAVPVPGSNPSNLGDELTFPNVPLLDFVPFTFHNSLREDTGSVKLDYQATEKDRVSARWNLENSNTIDPFGINQGQIAPERLITNFVRLDETHTFGPTLINEFGLAMNRFDSITSSDTNLPAFGGFFINLGSLPGPNTFNQLNAFTTFQVLESLTKTVKSHTLVFGADIKFNRLNQHLQQQETFDFASFANLVDDQPFTLTTQGWPAVIGVRSANWDFYAQDDWRVRHNLSINLGIRYDYDTIWHEAFNRIVNFDVASQQFLPSGQAPYTPTYTNFGPRVGFSYDPFGKGKTVIHGFGGLFYLPIQFGFNLASNEPQFAGETINVFQAPIAYPEPNPPLITGTQNVIAFLRNSREPYATNWLFGIQQELAPNTIVTVNYMGNKTTHMEAGDTFATVNVNLLNPITGARPYPDFGNEDEYGTFLRGSKYNALQVQFRHTTKRFIYEVNYSWAHELDNDVNVFGSFEDPYNTNLDYGSGDIDVRHNLTADVLYDLPQLKASSRLVRGVWAGGKLRASCKRVRDFLKT